MVCNISFLDVAFEDESEVFVHSSIFPLWVEFIYWIVHLLARKDQTLCQVNDVCGISGFCVWLWMLRFIPRNYWEGEARSVFCLFHAPVDFLIQSGLEITCRRRLHPLCYCTRAIATAGGRGGKLSAHSCLPHKIRYMIFFQLSGCFAVDFHFIYGAQTQFFTSGDGAEESPALVMLTWPGIFFLDEILKLINKQCALLNYFNEHFITAGNLFASINSDLKSNALNYEPSVGSFPPVDCCFAF